MGSQQLIAFKKLLASIKCGKLLSNKINLSGDGLNDDQVASLFFALHQLPEQTLNKLYELDLSNNNLTQIKVKDFPRLSVLNLSNNKIHTVIIKNLPFIRKLNLLDNPIKHFDPTEYFGIAEFLIPQHFLQPFILELPKTISFTSLEHYFAKSISSFLRKDSVRELLVAKYYCLAVAGKLPYDLISKIVLDEFKGDLNQHVQNSLQAMLDASCFSYRSAQSAIRDKFLLEKLPDMVETSIKYLAVSFANNKALNRVVNKSFTLKINIEEFAVIKPRRTLAWQYIGGLLKNSAPVKSKALLQFKLKANPVTFHKTFAA